MDGNPERVKVHALLVRRKSGIGLVSLSRRYMFSLVNSASAPDKEGVVLCVSKAGNDPLFNRQIPVETLTVLYGENASGKTYTMVEACGSLCSTKGERAVALVWERDGLLFFDPGSFLKKYVSPMYEGAPIPHRGVDETFGVAFYTTSPFEATKRRALKSRGVLDVTPPFSSSNPFEGAALLRAFSKLPKEFEFISEANVKLRVRVPSLRSVLDKIVPSLKWSNRHEVTDAQRRTLARVDVLLDKYHSKALAIHLLSLWEVSQDQAQDLLLNMAATSGLLHLNGKEIGEDAASRFRSIVFQTVTGYLYESADFNSAHMMLMFLESVITQITGKLGSKTTLGRLSTEFSTLTESEWGHLDQASRRGFIKWSFHGLSSGQVALLLLFSSLSSALSRLPENKTTFIFIDEGEMFMHPSWQRRYITDLVEFLGQFTSIAPFTHVVLATHSLIVAADAPPNRLYDVQKGEMANGFGYGPKDLLGNIYGVKEFHGEIASSLIGVIADRINGGNEGGRSAVEAMEIADRIADKRLKSYLVSELGRRAYREAASRGQGQ